MNAEFMEALNAIEKERGISKDILIDAFESALIAAYKRNYGTTGNVRAVVDRDTGEVQIFASKTVVEQVENIHAEISLEKARAINPLYEVGDVFEEEANPRNFGRIAAQTAKQVVVQRIREAERGMMIKEYEEKKEEIVTAVVEMVDPLTQNAVLELGKNRMTLFRAEQIPGETLTPGQRVKVFVTEVKKSLKGPTVSLSRIHPGLIKRLFELEVPEIADGTVEIKAIAREAGSRTKMAVYTSDPNIAPIGTCIGPKGARKNKITEEIGNEKIDIIKYSDVSEEFIAAALAPASVISVSPVADNDRMYRVIVNDDQLSLAIGKEGQNARLAAKLTGFKIDIKPASAENNETEADTAKDEDTIITDAHEAEAADAAEAPLE